MNLAGTTEIAAMLGVSKQRASQIIQQPNFPKPVDVLARGGVWRRSDVERWILRGTDGRPPGLSASG